MKVSLNWLKDYLSINLSSKEIADKLTELGLEATFINSGKSFKGVVLGKILECASHPDAEKLFVCKVDIGDDHHVSDPTRKWPKRRKTGAPRGLKRLWKHIKTFKF